MKKTNLLTLVLVAFMLMGSFYIQPLSQSSEYGETEVPVMTSVSAGFDSENITISLLNVTDSEGELAGGGGANQTTLVGTVDMFLDITSVNGPLNLTLFVEDIIYYSNYNGTEVPAGTLNMTLDTGLLPEGTLNFTILLSDNSTGTDDKESYHLIFTVDNHGVPSVDILSPVADSTFTGSDDIELNISSDYDEVFLNITVDGEITPEYNATIVPTGVANITINGSRYENGHHEIVAVVYTEEGLEDTASITLVFLDHIRFFVNDLAEYADLAGVVEFDISIETPYDSISMEIYVDGTLDSSTDFTDFGDSITVQLNTSEYSEGEHNFTFIAKDSYGHMWEKTWIYIIDNHGIPEIDFVSPVEDVVVGYAAFTVNIESTWDSVTVLVYVDDTELVGNYSDVSPGDFTFFVDTNLFSKWEHTVKVVVETQEGESAEVEDTFGFANLKIEEIISFVLLLGLAVAIPLVRKKGGEPIRPVLLLDLIYLVVVAAGFLILGINTLGYALWHFNLPSIWILGSILVVLNWIFPLIKEE